MGRFLLLILYIGRVRSTRWISTSTSSRNGGADDATAASEGKGNSSTGDAPTARAPKIKLEAPKIEMRSRSLSRSRSDGSQAGAAGGEDRGQAAGDSGSAAQGGADGGDAGAGQPDEAFDGAGAFWTDIWRDAESECHAAGDDRGDWQSVRRNARAGGCAARRGGLDGDRQRTEVGIECRRGSKVASAGIPGSAGTSPTGTYGRVASAGIPAITQTVAAAPKMTAAPVSTNLEVISNRLCSTPARPGN